MNNQTFERVCIFIQGMIWLFAYCTGVTLCYNVLRLKSVEITDLYYVQNTCTDGFYWQSLCFLH